MNIDDAGHKHGLDTRNTATAHARPTSSSPTTCKAGSDAGYQGAGDGRPRHEQRPLPQRPVAGRTPVPLFVFGDAFSFNADAAPKQTEICGTVCELLGVPHDKPVCRELLK
jgi:hypothetical protein